MKLGEYLQPETEKIPTSMKLSEYLSTQEETKSFVDKAIEILQPAVTSAGAGFAEEMSFGVFEAGEEQKQEFIPYVVGRVAGGVTSLMTVGGALKAVGLGAKALQLGRASVGISRIGARFIPRAIMYGATFGTHTLLNKTVEQIKNGGEDVIGAGVSVAKDTAIGGLLGVVGGIANKGTSVIAGAGLGYTASKLDGNDEPTNIITGLMWGAFELIGSRGKDYKLRAEAIGNIQDNLAKYAVKKGVPEATAKRLSNSFILEQASKCGGLKNVLKSQEKTLTYLEILNRNIFRANAKSAVNPEVKGITFDEVVKSSTEVVKPTTPVAPAPQITVSDQSKVIQTPASMSMTDQSKVEQPQVEALTPEEQSVAEAIKKGMSEEEFVVAKFNKKPSYGMSHRPTFEGMPPAHNLLEGEAVPKNVYEHPERSVAVCGLKDLSTRESWAAVKELRGFPEKEVVVYRATIKNELNIGDWISFSKNYAEDSVEPNSGEKVFSFKIKAKDAIFAGDDINEFGYYPSSDLRTLYRQTKAKLEQPVTNVEPPAEPPAIEDIGGDNIDPYDKVVNIEKKKESQELVKKTKELIDKALVPISTRLAIIAESLRDVIRKHTYSVNITTKKDLDAVVPFLEKFKDMTSEDSIKLDYALKNSDVDFINNIVKKYGLEKEYEAVRKTLDNIYERAKDAGMDIRFIHDYFPRRITDVEEYLKYLRGSENWGAIKRAFQEEEANIGRPLLEEEKAELVNSMIRGFGKDKITIKRPSNIKERQIFKLTPEMNAFYKDSKIALAEYIRSMNDNIEARKFFGKGENLENSVGNYVARLVDDQIISPEDEETVRQILKSYFDKRGTHGIVTVYKNLSYIATMGSPISAVTQIGDLAFSLYRNGFFGTVKGLVGKKAITKQDLGIDVIIDEFTDQSKSGKLVTNVFKIVGLDKMDTIAKETLVNASFDRMHKLAIKEDKELISELQRVFGDKSGEVLEDFKNKVPTDDVKYMLFAELLNFQPIAITEMPEYYVRGGNLRIFYMLKSYVIKQIDVYNNEVFRKKDPKEKMKNFLKLSIALILMNATADTIKDMILGRKTKLQDIVIDNILRLVGFSKWQLYKTREDGILATFFQSILPPTPFIDEVYKDAMRFANKKNAKVSDMRIWQRIPVVGKFYFWWFGGGKEIKNKKKRNSIRD